MSNTNEKLDCWAVVELMGHQRIAGKISERTVAGTPMLQVDVPAVGEVPAYSRLLGGTAIYAINPCDEEVATQWCKSIGGGSSPLVSWDGKQLIEKLVAKRLEALPEAAASNNPTSLLDLM